MDPTADRGQRSPLRRAEGQARYPHPSGTIPRTCARRSTARSMPLAHGLGRRDDRANPTLYSAARVPHSVPSRAYARGTTPASPACTTRRDSTSPTPATPCTRQALGATTDETTATGVAQAVHRCELPPARSSATAADLARLPASWCDTYAQMQRWWCQPPPPRRRPLRPCRSAPGATRSTYALGAGTIATGPGPSVTAAARPSGGGSRVRSAAG